MGMDQQYPWSDDRTFLEVVRRMRHIGYGRMMQIIAHEWFSKDRNGVQIANTTFNQLTPIEQAGFEALYQQDPLFAKER